MKRVVVGCVMLALCFQAWAAGPVDPLTQQQINTLCLMLAALTAQVANLAAAAATEDVGPVLQAAIEETIGLCITILDALGYTVSRPLEGNRG